MIQVYVKRPNIVYAVLWLGDNLDDIEQLCQNMYVNVINDVLYITADEILCLNIGDYIVRTNYGKYLVFDAIVFHNNYDMKE